MMSLNEKGLSVGFSPRIGRGRLLGIEFRQQAERGS
jgi:hypothetical protein